VSDLILDAGKESCGFCEATVLIGLRNLLTKAKELFMDSERGAEDGRQ